MTMIKVVKRWLITICLFINEFIGLNLEDFDENVQPSIDEANRMRLLLNVNQLNVCNAILAALNEQPSVENQHSRLFFMDGPAGSGKNFHL